MTRAEFLQAFPREPLCVIIGGEVISEVPLGADEIICDFCNADPGDTCYLIYGTKGICPECFKKTVEPYIVNKG